MNKELLKEYADLKEIEKATAARLEELKPNIIEEMRKVDVDKVETGWGSFTLGETSRWTYSDAVTDLQEEEKARGIAKRTMSTVLKFTKPNK